MLRRIDSLVKHNTDILEPVHFDAASSIGQKITAVWKVNGNQIVVQIDGREDRLYHWDKDKWVGFTPISLTPTDNMPPTKRL
jgi:hypothetical protein